MARDAPLQNSVFTSTAIAQQFSLVSFHLASSAVFQVPLTPSLDPLKFFLSSVLETYVFFSPFPPYNKTSVGENI